MKSIPKFAEDLLSFLEEINPETLCDSFEDCLGEIFDVSEFFRIIFFGTVKSEPTGALDQLRQALDEIRQLPSYLRKLLRYENSGALSDLANVDFKKLNCVTSTTRFSKQQRLDYGAYKILASRVFKTAYFHLHKWMHNQISCSKYMYEGYWGPERGDYDAICRFRDIFARINRELQKPLKLFSVPELKNIQFE